MREEIDNLRNQALADIVEAATSERIEEIRLAYLGRKGSLNRVLKQISGLEIEAKKSAGKLINETKQVISSVIEEKNTELLGNDAAKTERLDVTTPGIRPNIGHLHPQTKILWEIIDIFNYLGYQVADGPEIESDYFNFESLNIPKEHPARDTQQTLYIDTKGSQATFGEAILRTQTSAMQGRVMKEAAPPFRVIVPGKNYRYEQIDASHGFEFWQVEGFVVDKNISLTDLFGTIEYVLKRLFGDDAKIRFATTNFPFVEPGVDAYLGCTICHGKGCTFCKKTGWSEIMPAGMIHPFVLQEAGIDTSKWGGFAFAIGLSRVVNLRYQISDLRTLTTPDPRIVEQF